MLVEAVQGFNDEHVALARFDGAQPVFYVEASGAPTLTMLKQAYDAQDEVGSYGKFESALRAHMQDGVQKRLSGGSQGRVLNGAMVWGQLAGNIGYIGISRMGEFSDNADTATDLAAIRAEMDRAIAGLANTKAVIVDVAINDGGYDLVSAEIAGSFADRRPAFTVRQRRPQGRTPSEWFVEPKGGAQYRKPVYLLTTDRTVSAGDTLALMMRELPNVTQVGQPTSGSMSNKLLKSLPGNFVVSLSNESYIDPRGNLYEGRGVPPKLALPVFSAGDPASLFGGHDAALERLIALAKR
ncbi:MULTISPECIES: S41 family peptidase [unclassified Janthinobacterium]|uniref:S41 family peptidase n=1 Tax=unclassified Janthinobacterium TaxID=2610881 RepID=UPI001E5B9183|nr:S41 family peptidase [Janthinobacterium sp. CG3]